jgi:hypothetical protein
MHRTAFNKSFAACVACSLAVAGSANAGFRTGQSVTLQEDSNAVVEFISQSAGAKGSLYFLGADTGDSFVTAPSSDENGLGKFLFSNHGTARGTTVDLGNFGAGSTLHFAYLITKGVSVAPTGSLFKSNVLDDVNYFGMEGPSTFERSTTFRLGIEDIRNPKKSDFDYNDVIVEVRAVAIPTPGTLALATAGLAFVTRRRATRI